MSNPNKSDLKRSRAYLSSGDSDSDGTTSRQQQSLASAVTNPQQPSPVPAALLATVRQSATFRLPLSLGPTTPATAASSNLATVRLTRPPAPVAQPATGSQTTTSRFFPASPRVPPSTAGNATPGPSTPGPSRSVGTPAVATAPAAATAPATGRDTTTSRFFPTPPTASRDTTTSRFFPSSSPAAPAQSSVTSPPLTRRPPPADLRATGTQAPTQRFSPYLPPAAMLAPGRQSTTFRLPLNLASPGATAADMPRLARSFSRGVVVSPPSSQGTPGASAASTSTGPTGAASSAAKGKGRAPPAAPTPATSSRTPRSPTASTRPSRSPSVVSRTPRSPTASSRPSRSPSISARTPRTAVPTTTAGLSGALLPPAPSGPPAPLAPPAPLTPDAEASDSDDSGDSIPWADKGKWKAVEPIRGPTSAAVASSSRVRTTPRRSPRVSGSSGSSSGEDAETLPARSRSDEDDEDEDSYLPSGRESSSASDPEGLVAQAEARRRQIRRQQRGVGAQPRSRSPRVTRSSNLLAAPPSPTPAEASTSQTLHYGAYVPTDARSQNARIVRYHVRRGGRLVTSTSFTPGADQDPESLATELNALEEDVIRLTGAFVEDWAAMRIHARFRKFQEAFASLAVSVQPTTFIAKEMEFWDKLELRVWRTTRHSTLEAWNEGYMIEPLLRLPYVIPAADWSQELGRDPETFYVSISARCREEWGLPDLSLSFSACPRPDNHLDLTDPLPFGLRLATGGEKYQNVGAGSLLKTVEQRHDKVLASFPVQAIARAVVHVRANPEGSVDPQEWLRQHVLDNPIPVHRVYLHRIPGRYNVRFVLRSRGSRSLSTPDLELALEMRDRGQELIAAGEREHGRDFMTIGGGLEEAQAKWWAEFGVGEQEPTLQQRAQAIREAADICWGSLCGEESAHLCGTGSSKRHDLEAKFPCDRMRGHICDDDWIDSLIRSASKRDLAARAEDNERRDWRRGVVVPWPDRVANADDVPEALWKPHCFDKDVVQQLVDRVRGLDPQTAAAEILREWDFLAPEAVAPSASESTVDVVGKALRALRCLHPSLDLWRQFDDWPGGSGEVNGHSRAAVRLVPTWLQSPKRSGHPFVQALCLAAQAVNATLGEEDQRDEILAILGRILDVVWPVEAEHENASLGGALPEELRPLSHELYALLEPSELPQAPLLSALLQAPAAPPTADAAAMAARYDAAPLTGPQNLREHLDDDEEAILDRILSGLREEQEALEAIAPEEEAEEGAWFGAVADVVEAQNPGLVIPRNADGMPTLFWPQDTPTRELLRLALRVWTRAILECDAGDHRLARWGLQDWGRGASWRVIVVWIIHYARRRATDGLLGLPLDLSGRGHSPLAPTGAAHRSHTLPLFTDTGPRPPVFQPEHLTSFEDGNCVVQAWWTNVLIGSRSYGEILQIFHNARPGVCDLLDRLRLAGVLPVPASVVQMIRDSAVLIREDNAEELRPNRVDPWEM